MLGAPEQRHISHANQSAFRPRRQHKTASLILYDLPQHARERLGGGAYAVLAQLLHQQTGALRAIRSLRRDEGESWPVRDPQHGFATPYG